MEEVRIYLLRFVPLHSVAASKLDLYSYLWVGAWNVTCVLVVLYVFGHLNERIETMVVALAGLLYATLRSQHLSTAISNAGVHLEIGKALDRR